MLLFSVACVLLGTALSLLAIILAQAVYRAVIHPLKRYPGPLRAAITDFYGAYQSYHGRLHLSIWQAHQNHGDIVRLGPNKLVFRSPKALHDIYMSKEVKKVKGYDAMLPAPNAFNTLMTIDKTRHRKRRKIVNQAFSEQAMLAFEPTLHQHIDLFLQQLSQPKTSSTTTPVDFSQKSRYLALDVMSSFSFGQSLCLQSDNDNRFVSDAIEATSLVCGMYNQWPFLKKMNAGHLFHVGTQTRQKFGKQIGKLMVERVALEKESKSDLFAFLLDARDPESGQQLLPNQLWSESRLLMIAGSETIATALAATFFYLAGNRGCYEKLVSEVRSSFSSSSDIRHGHPGLRRSEYLRACIDEAMRMTPPVGNALWREVGAEGLFVDDHFVPAGTEVGVSLYVVHHDESVFDDAWAFRPERWVVSETNPQSKVDGMRRAFYPFSLGPRRCLAQNFAYMELMLTLAKTVWFFDFELAGDDAGKLPTGGGVLGRTDGRHRPDEFQTCEHLTARTDGPWLRFACRPDHESELANVAGSASCAA